MLITDYEQIVESRDAPMIVLAGPGSGKTYLLGDRVTRLLRAGVSKEAITVLTYTTDANRDMIRKLTDTNGDWKIPLPDLPQVRTMHSLGLEIILEKPRILGLLKKDLQVQEDDTVRQLLFRDAALICGRDGSRGEEARSCKQCGDCLRNDSRETCAVCSKYWEIMGKCHKVDFDDQILLACRILESNKNILLKYQSKAKHLLVAEYQDINAAQFKLIELLSRGARAGLFAVGDDAQSIYSFRGGNPKFILEFSSYFSDAKIGSLTSSRRCHERIIDDASTVLQRYYPVWKRNPDLKFYRPPGDHPRVYHVPSEIAEAVITASIARRAVAEKKDVLILAPKKEFFQLIIRELVKRGLYCDCGVDFLPGRIEIVKRFLDWINNPGDTFLTRLVIEDMINTGIARVPGANKKRIRSEASRLKRVAVETEVALLWNDVAKATDLYTIIKSVDATDSIVGNISDALGSLLIAHADHKAKPGEFAKCLSLISGVWCDPSHFSRDMDDVVSLLQPQPGPIIGTARLKTLRKAKGLEASVVIMVGLEDDLIPGGDCDLAEQARLFYVSMTRAKEDLYLIHSYRRPRGISFGNYFQDKKRSRFLDAIGRKSEWKALS